MTRASGSTKKKVFSVQTAHALAKEALPVPGGAYSKNPCYGL